MNRNVWVCVLLCLPLCGCHGELATRLGFHSVVAQASASARKEGSPRSSTSRRRRLRVAREPVDASQGRPGAHAVSLTRSWFVDGQSMRALRKARRPWRPARCVPAQPQHWFRKASMVAGRKRLKPLLRKQRIWIPWGVHMLVTRVVPGVGQPAFVYESYKDTGFAHSRGRFWPASSVKLMAAVGALVRLKAHGLDGDTYLRFSDRYGTYRGSLYPLYKRAVGRSTNRDYDRLVTVATQLRLNRDVLHPRYGMPNMSIRCAYGLRGSLATSPEIHFKKGDKEGKLPARKAPQNVDKRCPYTKNCTTLFELQEGLRRVMLHNELPPRERFALPKKDVKRLQNTLLAAWSAYLLTVRHEWGKESKIWNKGGCHRPHDHIENTYIESPNGKRIFIAISVPFTKRRSKLHHTMTRHQYLARGILRSYEVLAQGPPLQPDAGHPMQLKITRSDASGTLSIQTDPKVQKLKVWLGRQSLSATQVGPGQFELSFQWPSTPQGVFVVQGLTGTKPTSYRSILFKSPGLWRPTCR